MRLIISLVMALAASMGAYAQFDLGSLLKSVAGQSGDSTSTGGTLGNLLGGIANAIKPADITGTWEYTGPAVTFESENLLMKAGGAAAATTIEKKLEPYYQKAGIDQMKLVVNRDSTFTMTFRRGKLNGDLTQGDADGSMVFNFKIMGKIKLGKMDASISKLNKSKLSLTFDVSKLMKIVNSVAGVSGISSLQSLNKLLQQYDGLQAGFALKKTADAPADGTDATDTTASQQAGGDAAKQLMDLLNSKKKK